MASSSEISARYTERVVRLPVLRPLHFFDFDVTSPAISSIFTR
jgi:hypothetical protein